MESQRGIKQKMTNKLFIVTFVVLINISFSSSQHADDHYYVEATPALKLSDEDLTTVLLVNNANRSETHGRFLNVRPTIGLLTSTARTFIQEGVTTEYATQILGTTLGNGRLYAQLLKKSSRVLYDKDNIETSILSGGAVHTSIVGETTNSHVFSNPKILWQSHNDLVGDKDWQDIDDSLILEKNAFVVNTDYIPTVSKVSNVAYPLKVANHIQERGNHNESIELNSKSSSLNPSTLAIDAFKIKANKVMPPIDLPTFTVKNMFSPSGFSWDSPIEATGQQQKKNNKPIDTFEPRSPKLLYQNIMKEERRPLSTVTYYGFAEFTTIVGDSVIVFSPSTSTDKFSVGQVTSIKGEATLGHQGSSFASNTAIAFNQDSIEPSFVVSTLSTNFDDFQIKSNDMKNDSKKANTILYISNLLSSNIQLNNNTSNLAMEPTMTNDLYNTNLITALNANAVIDGTQEDEISASQEETTLQFENVDEEFSPTTTEVIDTEHVGVVTDSEEEDYDTHLISSMSDILSLASAKESTPTESQSEIMLSRPSDEEILQIISSLASVEAAEKASKTESQFNSMESKLKSKNEVQHTHSTIVTDFREQIQAETKIEGGATTIFFEDDPFLDLVLPDSVSSETNQWIPSSVYNSKSHVEEPNMEEVDEIVDTVQPTKSVLKSEVTVNAESYTKNATTAEELSYKKSGQTDLKNTTTPSYFPSNPEHIIKEISENEEIEGCVRTSQVFFTQIPKTITYYTTYLLSDQQNNSIKTSSIETNIVPSFDISQATKHYCIQPTQELSTVYKSEEFVLERPSMEPELKPGYNTIRNNIKEDTLGDGLETTVPYYENKRSEDNDEMESIDASYEDDKEEEEENDEDDQDSGEEIELIYRTLYTTYTYLTTFFHDSTTSVSSHKEVITNIITSSLGTESSTSINYMDISPTASILNNVVSTVSSKIYESSGKSHVQSSDLIEIDDILRHASDDIKPTTPLNDDNLLKTYYTTYTYYTTIFVDGETEVMSRTEVHTNVVGTPSDISPTPRNLNIDETIFEDDNAVIKINPTLYESVIKTPIFMNEMQNVSSLNNNVKHKTFGQGVTELESSSSSYSSRTEKRIIQLEDAFLRGKSDVQASIRNVEYQTYENEDQVSSESNRDEIIPSATLLLQTSFTTFTYYTTMYSSDTTNIVSRLETITNIVTETLQPTKTINIDEATLPVTYFTTFTYWTKLAKDGDITTLSREETVSNIVTPSLSVLNKNTIESTPTLAYLDKSVKLEDASKTERIIQTEMPVLQSSALITYYTTYTYYTTSYSDDKTITDSRFETVTNVVSPTNVSPSKILENTNITSPIISELVERTIAYDFKTIVDADEVSTLYLKTVMFATKIDGISREITSSFSSINIDEIKKATLSLAITNANESTRNYKTGLVRLIEGTELLNRTTTVYQSKVIGTLIDDRYAQIIESTSSFIIEKTHTPPSLLEPEIIFSSTLLPTSVQPTEFVKSTAVKSLQSSITDPTEENEQDQEFDDEDENDGNDEDGDGDHKRTRLSFQTRKRTFTPVIRPFASRNRPQFAPKRKNVLQSSATIITRSDFTPTITATPALKSDSRGRFTSSRKSNNAFTNAGFSTGSKRFGRPSKSSQFGNFVTTSSLPSSRNRLTSTRTQGFSSGFSLPSSRRISVSFRNGATTTRLFSTPYGGNSRHKIRPSSSVPFDIPVSTEIYTTLPPDSADEGAIQKYDSNDESDVNTENSRRNSNPLLRFRRPQVSRSTFQLSQRNTSTNQSFVRRPPQQKAKSNSPNTLTTTVRPKTRTFQRPVIGQIQNRSRLQSHLFPPRKLFQTQSINEAFEEEQKTGDDFEDNGNDENNSADYENDTDIDHNEAGNSNRKRRDSFSELLGKSRSKRQTDSNARSNFRNRFRRPTTSKPAAEDRFEEFIGEEPSTLRSRATSRFTPRSHSLSTSTHSSSKPQSNSRTIRPTKPNSNNRAQFTLREKDTTPKLSSRASNFRRPTPNGISSRRATTAASRPKTPRLKSYGNTVTESSHSSPRGRSSTSRTRATTRGRNRNDITTDAMIPVFDGTITVTHISPTEITIPVVNGKVTEYKNIVTTTTSTEVLIPNQYTSVIGQNGASTLVLNKEETSINVNGATEITQFVLKESITSTVIFTPTTIRGRKTSFAHVIPSTVYQVENIVSTMQANIAASAPLANILLSQLLLGNIGLNQPNINPLLALGGTQAISQPPVTPTTEYKTRTSTYVTTVTNGMSTVIPLTFHGKEILTTIFDSTSNVITATEYFTETIVVTPTQQAHAQQVNSLLLPLLLQQQLQGPSQIQPSLPIQHSAPTQLLFSDNLQDLESNGIQKYNDDSLAIEDYSGTQGDSGLSKDSTKSNGRKNGRRFNKYEASPTSFFESSVITLYVSGRRPGEFSTVLSTVQFEGDSSLYKRNINRAYSQPVLKSESVDFEDFYRSDGSEIQEYLLPATNDISTSQAIEGTFLSEKTQSLESIVGDVDLWYAETSAQLENPMNGEPEININRHHIQQNINTLNDMLANQHETRTTHFPSISNTKSGHFIQLDTYSGSSPVDDETSYLSNDAISDAALPGVDEARYNLATRVMSNGVEVIIAGDKNGKSPHKSNVLKILPSLAHKPMTFAPSTLKNQIILVMPSDAQENYTISINSNNFITKTCLTTYTYRTTYLQDGITTIESHEKVVSNTATEERNYYKISPTGSLGVTLSRTPELAVGIFHTTYTYYNTILDGDLPIIHSSQHILTNTITGPDDYISFLQPSEEATPVHETNTYFSSISLTKTLKESNSEHIFSTPNVLTQVVITESLPPRSTAASYIAIDTDENTRIQEKSVEDSQYKEAESNHIPTHIINLQNNQLQVNQHLNPAKDSLIKKSPNVIVNSTDFSMPDVQIYATKTYLTTLTYFTTLIDTEVSATPSTIVNVHTRVIENVITESIPSFVMKSEDMSKFQNILKSKNRQNYITLVTLPTGQSLEITAVNILHSSSIEKNCDSTKITKPKPSPTLSFEASVENDDVLDSETVSLNEQFMSNAAYINAQKNSSNVSHLSDFPSVNKIIEKLNFNRLQALGPVFNAMAGLIQNNFGGLSNDFKKNLTALNLESKHSTKNITAYDNSLTHEGPIYIPVQSLKDSNAFQNANGIKVTAQIAPQSLHLSPPRTNWFGSENKNHIKVEHNMHKATYETPLLNGGIPISPGEVITANSDVIVGKPNGIQPHIPYGESHSNVTNAILAPSAPKPYLPFSRNSYTHLKQTKAIPRPIPLDTSYDKETNFDGILKPPPKPLKSSYQNAPLPHNILNHNYRIHYAGEHMHPVQQQLYEPLHQLQYQPQTHLLPIMQQTQQPPNKELIQKASSLSKIIWPQKNNYIMKRPGYDSQPLLNKKTETDPNKELYNNEILEIRRIPEVYSTDLPSRESVELNSGNEFTNFKTQIKKVVGSDKQPMLVDIKPSQITNVLIPRDNSASFLYVQSDVDRHKNGQYYDEPTIYADNIVADIRKQSATLHKPILSNQQVNLDTNVLSHNIDINVPPLTFNKDSDFPHSTPVRGQISKKEESNFFMPHITIPITDNQVQVNLTPHNTLTLKTVESSNNMDSTHGGRNKYITESFQNIPPIRYLTAPGQNHNEQTLNVFSKTSEIANKLGDKKMYHSLSTNSAALRPVTSPLHVKQIYTSNGNFNTKKESEDIFPESAVRRPTYFFRRPQDNHVLYKNITTTKPTKLNESNPRPTFNPAPLLHLFYGLNENDFEYTKNQLPVHRENSWEKDFNDSEDENINATEDLGKMDDQKVSSSVNIAVPLQNKVKKAELLNTVLDQSKVQTNLNQSGSNNFKQNLVAYKSAPIHSDVFFKNSDKTVKPTSASLPFGSELYLDSSSINVVNNIKELSVLSTSDLPPSTFISVNKRPIYAGKPFTKIKTTVNQSLNTENLQSIFINSGEGFKLRTVNDENQAKPLSVKIKETEKRVKENTNNKLLELKIYKDTNNPTSTTTIRPQPIPTKIVQSYQNQLHPNYTQYSITDSSKIDDSYGSIDRHNYSFINLKSNESIKIKTLHQHHGDMGSPASKLPLNNKPLPIPLNNDAKNIIGLIRPSTSSSLNVPLFVNTEITTKIINATNLNHNHHFYQHSYIINQSIEKSTLTKISPISYTKTTLKLKPKTLLNSVLRTSHTSNIYATPTILKIKTASTIGYATPVIDKIPLGILISSKISNAIENTMLPSIKEETSNSDLAISTNTNIPEITGAEKKDLILNSNSFKSQILTLNQEIPDKILIEPTVVSYRRNPSITRFGNHTLIYQELPLSKLKPSTLLNTARSGVLIPANPVTNTSILTKTTVNTTDVTSRGIPSTQILPVTKTNISKLINTGSVTHNLFRPSEIREVLYMTPTKIVEADQHNYQSSEDISQVDRNDDVRNRQDLIPIITSINSITTPNSSKIDENNSIFIVMTDKKSNGGAFSIIPTMIDTPHSIDTVSSETDHSIGLDYDENIAFNLPTRDEDFEINEVNHVLLGGVLIATPPKSNDNSHLNISCKPSCKASRNEICHLIDNRMTCTCRPGFARMFPDRPCRPTYTYAMQVPIHRINKQGLHFKEQYHKKDSDEFKQLAEITHDAVDRMIMQSDLRDVYHGVHVTSFDAVNSENGVLGTFLIQLSDNSDKNRLVDVLKKYLRQHDFSLGDTEIFTTKNGVNSLEIIDFDECAHSQFHDCSENSKCFNLQGTYTCSCQEGYIDLSENAIYPGRICSGEIVGCENCHYHGKCVQDDKSEHPICECFHWFTGASCQVNLKVLLLALVTVGTILFIMLLICLLLACAKKKKHHIHIIAPRRLSSKNQKSDKRAMIKDSSSETSQNSLPYTLKDGKKQTLLITESNSTQQGMKHYKQVLNRNINQRGQPPIALVSTLSETDSRQEFTEQADRSLTVMIPRAKYHHSLPIQYNADDNTRTTLSNEAQLHAVPIETETKSFTCHCNIDKKTIPSAKKNSSNTANHGQLHASSIGALVSAGFEVSATVRNVTSERNSPADTKSGLENNCNELYQLNEELHLHNKAYRGQYSQYNSYKNEEKFIDSMDVWLGTIQQNELTAEIRSFDETTIQAPTKSLRSMYDRQITQNNTNDEANTMAERDIGSTFLLPHTHLYKPDRDSDISGFDSI